MLRPSRSAVWAHGCLDTDGAVLLLLSSELGAGLEPHKEAEAEAEERFHLLRGEGHAKELLFEHLGSTGCTWRTSSATCWKQRRTSPQRRTSTSGAPQHLSMAKSTGIPMEDQAEGARCEDQLGVSGLPAARNLRLCGPRDRRN